MRDTTHDSTRPKPALRWKVMALALCAGLGLNGLPGHSQDSNDQSEDFQTTGGKRKHRKRQDHPISLGTSGSNVEAISGGFCCGGTLGALVEKLGSQYILSNNHVLGRSNAGKTGEVIIQPGYSDQSCPAFNVEADTVAHLTARKKVRFGFDKNNKVDLAMAEVAPGAVRADGEVLKIGIPGSNPAAPFVGMRVKKSGRTTGLTHGVVTAINVTVTIEEFPLDCAALETRPARFVKQFVIAGLDGKRFLGSGDSGSMVYEDVDQCPAPVGLLFAGGESFGAAAPASAVLKQVKKLKPRGDASFVGCESSSLEVTSARSQILRPQRVREASDTKRVWEDRLLAIQGVQAVGIGITLSGPVEPAIWVFATDSAKEMSERLPDSVGEFRIEVIETDRFEAYCGR